MPLHLLKGVITIAGNKWDRIKAEYIAGNTSYRKLAKKYKVSLATITAHSNKERWIELRQEARNKAETITVQKTADSLAECTEIAAELKLRLFKRLKEIEEAYPFNATEVRANVNGKVAVFRIRDLTAAYRDIIEYIPKDEDTTTMEKLDAMLAEVKSHAFNA